MSVLTSYDLELDDLADRAGQFNAVRFDKTQAWIRRQWLSYGSQFGFRNQLDRVYRSNTRRSLATADALAAFSEWFKQRVQPGRDSNQARIRHMAIRKLRELSPSNLWLPEVDSLQLPETGCFTPESMTGETPAATPRDEFARVMRTGLRSSSSLAVQPRHRAFRSDVTASFFHARDDNRGTGCAYPVKLSLGTFPYVYGRNLGNEPPGLHWATDGDFAPAVEAMRIASAMWTQEGNLAQDARVVLAHYRRFKQFAGAAVDRALPGARDPRTGVMRSGIAASATPRGTISSAGYNFVLLAFARFFAARRAYVRAQLAFTPRTKRAIRANPDPILRQVLRAA